jgi:hypothetical protein
VLASTAEVSAKLSNNHLDTAFDVRRVLAHAGRAVDALSELD